MEGFCGLTQLPGMAASKLCCPHGLWSAALLKCTEVFTVLQSWVWGGPERRELLQEGCCPRGWKQKEVHHGVEKGLQALHRASAHQLMIAHPPSMCSSSASLLSCLLHPHDLVIHTCPCTSLGVGPSVLEETLAGGRAAAGSSVSAN